MNKLTSLLLALMIPALASTAVAQTGEQPTQPAEVSAQSPATPTEPAVTAPTEPVAPVSAEQAKPPVIIEDPAQLTPSAPQVDSTPSQAQQPFSLTPPGPPRPEDPLGPLGLYLQGGFLREPDRLELTGRIQNVFLWRNDSDFDRTAPYYNKQGQDLGVLGTFIAPKLEIRPDKALRIVWESEIGLNIWSMQDSDQYQMDGDKSFRLAIRQLYTEGKFLDGQFGFRAGYEQLFDPTGLFLGHWLGAASITTAQPWGTLTLTAAQVPDQTYEGAAYDSNNFNSDTFVYGLKYGMESEKYGFVTSLWGLHDGQVVGQELDLMTLTASWTADLNPVAMQLDAGLQYGITQGRAAGDDETTLAWSAQGSASLVESLADEGGLLLLVHVNALALSGDDEYDGNDFNGAWFYSGKSRSKTLLLTEDELRDRGGNIDELLAERRQGDNGKFYALRPGLVVTDLSVGLDVDHFFRPMATVGAGFVLNPDNSLGSSFVGLESDLHLEFRYKELLSFDLVGSFLQPGEAASAFINRGTDRSSTDPILQVEGVLTVKF